MTSTSLDERRKEPARKSWTPPPPPSLSLLSTHSTNSFQKNDWIVKIRWYELISVELNGDRMYKRGQVQFLNGVKMIVQKLTRSTNC